MMKRKFAAWILAGIGAIALAHDANAEGPYIGVDGCAALAQLVYAEVTAAAWCGAVSGHRTMKRVTRASLSVTRPPEPWAGRSRRR